MAFGHGRSPAPSGGWKKRYETALLLWYNGYMDKKNDTATDEKHREWPNSIRNRDELDSALEAGEKSGVSDRTIEQIFEEEITKFKNGSIRTI